MSSMVSHGICLTVACLLTYLAYSSASIGIVWAARKAGLVTSPFTRVVIWKIALVAPFPLALLAIVSPAPWLPTVAVAQLSTDSNADTSQRNRFVQGHDDIAPTPSSPLRSLPEFRHATGVFSSKEQDGSLSGKKIGTALATSSKRGDIAMTFANVFAASWFVGAFVGLLFLARDLRLVGHLIRTSEPIHDGQWMDHLQKLQRRSGVSINIQLRNSTQVDCPFACGIRNPCIVLPASGIRELSAQGGEAVLAHEFAHIVRRDLVWNLVTQFIRRVFFIQPLNVIAIGHLRSDAELSADRLAASLISDPAELARSIVHLAETLAETRDLRFSIPWTAAGMTIHESSLRGRVAWLLDEHRPTPAVIAHWKLTGITCVLSCLLLAGIPRFGYSSHSPHSTLGDSLMFDRWIKSIGLASGLVAATTSTAPLAASPVPSGTTTAIQSDSDTALPAGLNNFSGMLIGKMIERDIERGNFRVKVDYVARVWENNKSTDPRAVVGKEVTVNGVSGKWLDELLLVRPGETLEFEAQHRGGNVLTFPGEWLKKVKPFDPEEHPVPPNGFRGFAGMVQGKIISKNPTSREIHLRVDSIENTFERNKAKSAEEVLGKEIVLAGFWARMSKPFDNIEKGDTIRAGVLHRVPQSDHFTVIETAEKTESTKPDSAAPRTASNEGFPQGMVGFRGIMRGKLIRKDVEEGTLVVEGERVTRTWKQNKASDTASCRGQKFLVNGIAGKWLDVLITIKPGDSIEVEAFHNGGEHLDFVSEWLKKVD